MVKGITKRAVVVRPNGSQLFEQAIFIVAEDSIGVMSQQDMLTEATRIAGGYTPKSRATRANASVIFFVAGAAAMAAIWLSTLAFM